MSRSWSRYSAISGLWIMCIGISNPPIFFLMRSGKWCSLISGPLYSLLSQASCKHKIIHVFANLHQLLSYQLNFKRMKTWWERKTTCHLKRSKARSLLLGSDLICGPSVWLSGRYSATTTQRLSLLKLPKAPLRTFNTTTTSCQKASTWQPRLPT